VSAESWSLNVAMSSPDGAEIEYWQGGLRLVAFGGRDVARSLPQDETAAAVVLGAMLARNFDDGTWPGEYRAVVLGDGARVVIAEDDLRVAAARAMLRDLFAVEDGCPVRRDFSSEELQAARRALLAAGLADGELDTVAAHEQDSVRG